MNAVFGIFSGHAGSHDVHRIVGTLVDWLPSVRRSDKLRRRIERVLVTGEVPEDLVALLAPLLGDDGEARLRAAMAAAGDAAREARDALLREAFRPHVRVLHENAQPTSPSMFAMANGVERWMKVPLPDGIASWPAAAQADEVERVVTAHRGAHAGDSIPFLGRITGYRYCPVYGSSFDIGDDNRPGGADRGSAGDAAAFASL